MSGLNNGLANKMVMKNLAVVKTISNDGDKSE